MSGPRSKRLLLGPGHVGGRKPPRGGCLFALLLLLPLLLLARHRAPDTTGHPVGHRRHDPKHAAGQWHMDRDDNLAPGQQGGGKRPPLRDNLPNGAKP